MYDRVLSHMYERVMSHMYDRVMSHMYERVISHMYKGVMSHMYEHVMSHMYERVMSHIYEWVMSHMHEQVMSHMWTGNFFSTSASHINESCQTYQRVMSHMSTDKTPKTMYGADWRRRRPHRCWVNFRVIFLGMNSLWQFFKSQFCTSFIQSIWPRADSWEIWHGDLDRVGWISVWFCLGWVSFCKIWKVRSLVLSYSAFGSKLTFAKFYTETSSVFGDLVNFWLRNFESRIISKCAVCKNCWADFWEFLGTDSQKSAAQRHPLLHTWKFS